LESNNIIAHIFSNNAVCFILTELVYLCTAVFSCACEFCPQSVLRIIC